MSIYVEGTLPSEITDYLDSLSDELGRPIRVLEGNYQQIAVPGDWTQEQVDAVGVNAEECAASGVTIYNWASASQHRTIHWEQLPSELYSDGLNRDLRVREVMVPHEDLALGDIRTFGTDQFALCEVGDRTVWFLTTLGYIPSPEELNLDIVLRESINLSLDERRAEEMERRRAEQNRNSFIHMMTEEVSNVRLERRREELRRNETQLRSYETEMAQTMRQLVVARRELEIAEATASKSREDLIREWDQIEANVQVNNITFAGGSIRVHTKNLDLHNPNSGDTVPLGRFEIVIDTSGSSISLNNQTGRRQNRDHPHVDQGNPCWGGHSSEVLGLLAEFEIGALIEVILSYLETYNPDDDWGRYAAWWFDNPGLTQVA